MKYEESIKLWQNVVIANGYMTLTENHNGISTYDTEQKLQMKIWQKTTIVNGNMTENNNFNKYDREQNMNVNMTENNNCQWKNDRNGMWQKITILKRNNKYWQTTENSNWQWKYGRTKNKMH